MSQKIQLPHTFSYGGYQVTINKDRSIRVKSGDWISKYTMAIYHSYDKKNFLKFKKKVRNQYVDLEDVNRINVGDILYHPDQLPGEHPSTVPPTSPETPDNDEGKPQAGRITDLLEWLKVNFWATTDWKVKGLGGVDGTLSFVTAQYFTLGVTHRPSSKTIWYHAGAVGGTLGYPDSAAGASGAPVWFPGKGTIFRSPLVSKLTQDDFRGGIVVLEVAGGLGYFVGGGLGLTFIFFGIGNRPDKPLKDLDQFFRGYVDDIPWWMASGGAKGFAVCGGVVGLTAMVGSIGCSIRGGLMVDREYFGI